MHQKELESLPSWSSASTNDCFDGMRTRKRKVGQPETGSQKRACSASPASCQVQSASPNDSYASDSYASTTGMQRAFSQALDINDMAHLDLTSSDTLDEGSDGEDCCKSGRNNSSASLCSEGSSELVHCDFEEDCTFELDVSPSKKGYFVPKTVPRGCISSRFADFYRFTPYVISQGTSYFQRLATQDPWLRQAAAALPDFAMFVREIPDSEPRECRNMPIGGIHKINGDKVWCLAIHLTCIYLAAKVLDTISCAFLLQHMLCHVHHCQVSKDQALELEAEVLMALEWRLGPYFIPNM